MKQSTELKMQKKSDFGKERIEILYEDKDIMVIYKPEGLLSVSYPGSHSKTVIDIIEQIMRKKGTYSKSHRPFVVHRLDRETSGVMMFALNENAQKIIMETWHKMVTERLYIAVAENPKNPIAPTGLIDDEIAYNAYNVGFVPKNNAHPNQNAKNTLKNQKKVNGEKSIYERNLSYKDGKVEFKTISARTNYKILEEGPFYSLFELSLDTGRKNQIRAHLASKGYPLAGDENYRAKTDPFFRLALHAKTLCFVHPFTKQKMKFECPEPEDWILCVKNEKNPPLAIWQKQNYKKEKSNIYEEVSKNNKNIPSGKKLRGMDFIQKGKNFRKL